MENQPLNKLIERYYIDNKNKIMEQLRIYTLADKETAELYFKEHWSKHRINFPKFGFQVKGVWIGNTP